MEKKVPSKRKLLIESRFPLFSRRGRKQKQIKNKKLPPPKNCALQNSHICCIENNVILLSSSSTEKGRK
jgi:hypothetical protein